MNIAIIAHEYLPTVGGSIEVIRGLSQAFKSKSYKVIIVAFTMRRRFKRFEIIEGIPVYRLGCPFTIMPRPSLSGIVDIIKLLLSLPLIIIQLRRIIRKNKTQIINVHFVGINALCTWILSYFTNLKYVVSLHGFNVQVLPFLSGLRLFLARRFYKAILTKATFLTACSYALLQDAIKKVPQIKDKSWVIYNGISLEEFKQDGPALLNYPYLLCLGLLQSQFKGFDLALLAFRDILDLGFDINLVIAGNGPDRMAYERFMKLLGIEDRVFFFGPANRMQAVNLFKHCEFFVTPSRVEPLGIVNLEAMAAEKAVVATRTGGIPEVIDDGITGMVVEPCNDKALVKGIKQLLEDKHLREQLASNGRRKIEQADFSWSIIADKYLDIFKKFIDYGARLP